MLTLCVCVLFVKFTTTKSICISHACFVIKFNHLNRSNRNKQNYWEKKAMSSLRTDLLEGLQNYAVFVPQLTSQTFWLFWSSCRFVARKLEIYIFFPENCSVFHEKCNSHKTRINVLLFRLKSSNWCIFRYI